MSMLLDSITRSAIDPALSMLPSKMDSEDARVMLLATTLQEAEAVHRVQMGNGPAHGLWQFEEGGAVKGVMQHPASRDLARVLCAARKTTFDRHAVWQKLAQDDILAAGFARLLLWTDAHKLPDADSSPEECWDYYFRNWRPGKPHPEKWPKNLAQARAQVYA